MQEALEVLAQHDILAVPVYDEKNKSYEVGLVLLCFAFLLVTLRLGNRQSL